MADDAAYLEEDATDRRVALATAADLASRRGDIHLHHDAGTPHWLGLADSAYRWLRNRGSLRITAIRIIPGTPYPEGTTPMTSTFDLTATDEDVFTLTGQDANGNAVPLPANYSAAWTLSDPGNTGATLTQSADTTSATLVPDLVGTVTIDVTVTVTNDDGSTTEYQGAEAVVVAAGPINSIAVVPGTPTAEAAPPAEPSAS